MIDRQKVETILRRRFPNAEWKELATAVTAIMGLGDEWEEVSDANLQQADHELEEGAEFRLFRRAPTAAAK
jgi:hypothetical protein